MPKSGEIREGEPRFQLATITSRYLIPKLTSGPCKRIHRVQNSVGRYGVHSSSLALNYFHMLTQRAPNVCTAWPKQRHRRSLHRGGKMRDSRVVPNEKAAPAQRLRELPEILPDRGFKRRPLPPPLNRADYLVIRLAADQQQASKFRADS